MSDIKSKVQGLNPNIQPLDVAAFAAKTGNVYLAMNVISTRANNLNVAIKSELKQKLEEFAETTDTIQEVHENKEQIEISKFYERLPNSVLISVNEYENDELHYRSVEESNEDI